MNIKQTAILLGTVILMSVPLVFSPQVEARGKGGDVSHQGEHRHHDNHGHSGRHGYRQGGHQRFYGGHRRAPRGGRHGHHPRYRGWGYHYPPHSYYYGDSLVLGLYWPYGLSIYYQDW